MMEQEQDKTVNDRVNDIMTRNFSICKCPEETYKRFIDFSNKYTNSYYAMALQKLLDIAEIHSKDIMFFNELIELRKRIEVLEDGMCNKETKKEEEVSNTNGKTFGSVKVMNEVD